MRAFGVALVIISDLLTTASGRGRQPDPGAAPEAVVREWLTVLRQAYPLVRKPDEYRIALTRALELAARYPQNRLAAKTSEYTAFGLYNQFRFAEATRAYLRTKRLALAAGDAQTAAFSAHALSNIYLSAGNAGGALEAAQQAVALVPESSPSAVRAAFRIHHARLLARSGHVAEAGLAFTEVIEAAESQGLWSLLADAWKFAGRELALQGDLLGAERDIRQSLRLRHLHRDPEMASDYHTLAGLRLRAGHPDEALSLLDLADRHMRTANRFPAWRLGLLRGEARLAQGDSLRALEDLRRAIREIDVSPMYVLPGDLLRSQITRPAEAHELFVEAALQEFSRTGQRGLLAEAFAVSEAGRAAALRSASDSPAIPPSQASRYWKIVADLEEVNAQSLAQNDDALRRRVSQLRLALAELESGSELPAEPVIRAAARLPSHLLDAREALIVFQLGERSSLAWTLAAGHLDATRLPDRSVLLRQLRAWLDSLPGSVKTQRAAELYQTLFRALPAAVHRSAIWLVAADGELFRVPWAGLVSGFKSSRPVYLAESRALQLIPGSWALERRRPTIRSGRFLGVGDPIYNEADPRRATPWTWPGSKAGTVELTRLAGSAAEIGACARYWPSADLLLGERAVPAELTRSLASAPVAVHLAVHVVPAPDSPGENLVALGGGPHGRPSFVGPEWIGAHRLPGSLVVMNGCRSGSGFISAGEGLMGLTRAWLRAGASRVLSTYWPTLDDGGALMGEFYRQLTREGVSAAEALRRAQRAMIAQSDWRADPQYWAAYFLIGYPE